MARDGALALASRVLTAGLSLVAVTLATRQLAPADYGTLALVLVLSSLLYAFVGSWTILPTYVQAAREYQEFGAVGATAAARGWIVGIGILGFLALAIPFVLMTRGSLSPSWSIWIACSSAALGYVLCEQVTTLLESVGRFGSAAAVQVSRPLVYTAALLLLAVAAEGSLTLVLLALTLSWLVSTSAAALAATRLPLSVRGEIAGSKRRLLKASAPLIVYSVCQLVFAGVDIFFVTIFRPRDEVGYYALAYQVFSTGVLLFSAVIPVITPRLAAGGDEEVARYLGALRRVVYPIIGVGIAMGVSLVPLVLPLVFGAEYSGASEPLVILMLALAATVGVVSMNPVLLARHRARQLSVAAALALGLNVVLDLTLLGALHVGLAGPAAATVAATALVWVIYGKTMTALGDGAVGREWVLILPVALAVTTALTLPPSLAALFSSVWFAVGVAIVWRATSTERRGSGI